MAQTTVDVSKNTAFLATGKSDAQEGVTKATTFLATGRSDAQEGVTKIVAYLVTGLVIPGSKRRRATVRFMKPT